MISNQSACLLRFVLAVRVVQVQKSESKAAALVEDLRELPSAQALKLRASVAFQAAAARKQSAALDRQVFSLYRKGF